MHPIFSKAQRLKIFHSGKLDPVGSTVRLQDDEAVYWVSIGHYEAIAAGN